MKTTTAKLVLAAAALLLAGTGSAHAQFYQQGYTRPYNTPCPPGQNLRTYNYTGPSYQQGYNYGGQIGIGGISGNGGYNNQTTQPQRGYNEQWCVPYGQPSQPRPSIMPRQQGFQMAPPGPMANSTPRWIRPRR